MTVSGMDVDTLSTNSRFSTKHFMSKRSSRQQITSPFRSPSTQTYSLPSVSSTGRHSYYESESDLDLNDSFDNMANRSLRSRKSKKKSEQSDSEDDLASHSSRRDDLMENADNDPGEYLSSVNNNDDVDNVNNDDNNNDNNDGDIAGEDAENLGLKGVPEVEEEGEENLGNEGPPPGISSSGMKPSAAANRGAFAQRGYESKPSAEPGSFPGGYRDECGHNYYNPSGDEKPRQVRNENEELYQELERMKDEMAKMASDNRAMKKQLSASRHPPKSIGSKKLESEKKLDSKFPKAKPKSISGPSHVPTTIRTGKIPRGADGRPLNMDTMKFRGLLKEALRRNLQKTPEVKKYFGTVLPSGADKMRRRLIKYINTHDVVEESPKKKLSGVPERGPGGRSFDYNTKKRSRQDVDDGPSGDDDGDIGLESDTEHEAYKKPRYRRSDDDEDEGRGRSSLVM